MPSIPGYKLILMDPIKIQKKADQEGDFLYLSFSDFKVSSSSVVVTLMNGWAVGKKSDMVYLSGGTSTYEYRKVFGKWLGQLIGGTIS